jgi:uncharacterized membrane protein YvbJ
MQKAFEESRNRMREKIKKQKEIEIKKRTKKIITMIMLGIIIIIFLMIGSKLRKNAIESCVKKGNDYNYCVKHS